MREQPIKSGALVLYKNRPARVLSTGDKFEIELVEDHLLVRPKDVLLLHPGPVSSLKGLPGVNKPFRTGEVETAWELLAGGETNLEELSELVYGEFTPESAWAAWGIVNEGLYFRGENPDKITASTEEEVHKRIESRQQQAAEEKRWNKFLERVNLGKWEQEDIPYLLEVEGLALGQRSGSRVLQALGRSEHPEDAHAFLLAVGYWDAAFNPHPTRLGMNLSPPQAELGELDEENRRDLTHLESYAIDDEGSQDPDDAVGIEGEWKVWVHVADAASLVPPGSQADAEARSRGTNLYLPETTIPMLPTEAARRLGMGLNDVSPALSFGIQVDANGSISDVEVFPSWVRVQRMSYEEASKQMDAPTLSRLYEIAKIYQARRNRSGAISINLPEVKMRVEDGYVHFTPIPDLPSRTLVREAMVLAGEAAALFALRHDIPVPFAAQPASAASEAAAAPPEEGDLAGMYALRRVQSRGQVSSHPAPHTGLGLPFYTRVTSPLRRYLDLVAHQQLRLFLRDQPLMSQQEVLERVGESESITGSAVRSEFLSRRHWTLVYFLNNPGWKGEGVMVEIRSSQARLILPELGFETYTSVRGKPPLNARMLVSIQGVNLPGLEVSIRAELGFFGDSG
jgi:exoribonuclease II